MNEGNMAKIHIRGGEVFVTSDARKKYCVLEGTVLVFLVPLSSGEKGRRLFLAELEKDGIIPGFVADTEKDKSFRFALVALDEALIEENVYSGDSEEARIRSSFAERIGITLKDPSELKDDLVELYNLNEIKNEGYIYKSAQDVKRSRDKSLNMTRDIFLVNDDKNFDDAQSTANRIYNCALFLCKKENIQIAPKDKVVKSSGKDFLLDDIARVSHFTTRQIVLPDKWYKKDCGRFIAFKDADNEPVCLFPRHYGKYYAYDVKNDRYIKVDSKYAKELKSFAIMFYRPFPDEKITLPKLIAFGFKKVYSSDLIRIVVLALVGVLTGLLLPYLNELVYDKFILFGDVHALIQIGLVILSCALGNLAFTIVKNLSVFRVMSSMEYAVQSATIDRVFNLPEGFLRQYEAASLGTRVLTISKIYSIISEKAIVSLLAALFSFVYLTRMIVYSERLSFLAVIMLLCSVGITVIIGFRQVGYERAKADADQEAGSKMFQFINGIEKIRISSSENRALLQYLRVFIKQRQISFRKEKLTLLSEVITGASGLMFSIVFYTAMIGGDLHLSIGSFMGFMAAFGALYGAVFEIAENFLVFNEVYPLYELTLPILETLPEGRADSKAPDELTGEIELSNVSFSYEEDLPPVLSGINLRIKSGEYIGIVGASGCGKSTLLKLLMGFEKPQVGKIYYDGQDIDDIDKRELRKRFGVVLQEGGLISGSIYDNITITAPGCSMTRVKEVISEVGLEKDIAEMPMGLQTMVNEEGGTLSGGQIQRILIARAIAGKPRIIFLDEATSALDNLTQKQVTNTLKTLDATKVVIAHRLSTVLNCDRIIVMDQGSIVEEGTYEELMDKKGVFYGLAARQLA